MCYIGLYFEVMNS